MVADTASKNIIFTMIEKIKKEYKPEKIILFGSYAWGNPSKDSDLDILIIKEADDSPLKRWLKVRNIVYPPSQKTTGLPVDECEDNASADVLLRQDFGELFSEALAKENVTNGQAAKHSADNPSEYVEIVGAQAKRISTYLTSWGHKGTTGLPVGFHKENLFMPFEPLVYTPQELSERIRIGDSFIGQILNKGEVLYG